MRYSIVAEGNGVLLPVASNITEEEVIKKAKSMLCIGYVMIIIDYDHNKYELRNDELVKLSEKLKMREYLCGKM